MDQNDLCTIANFLIDLKSDHPKWLVTMSFQGETALVIKLQYDPCNGKDMLISELAFCAVEPFNFVMFKKKVTEMESALWRAIQKQ